VVGKTKSEAFTLKEAELAKLPLPERRAALAKLVRSAEYAKLPD
jgi:ATP-dependent DNA ligase